MYLSICAFHVLSYHLPSMSYLSLVSIFACIYSLWTGTTEQQLHHGKNGTSIHVLYLSFIHWEQPESSWSWPEGVFMSCLYVSIHSYLNNSNRNVSTERDILYLHSILIHSKGRRELLPPLLLYAILKWEKVWESDTNSSLPVTYIDRIVSSHLLTAVQGAAASMRRSCHSALSLIQSLPDH